MTNTRADLKPGACYVCGGVKHPDRAPHGHNFWSNADADAYFNSMPDHSAAAYNGASLDAEAGLPLGSRFE